VRRSREHPAQNRVCSPIKLGEGLGVNTPRSKPVVRYPAHRSKATLPTPGPDGSYIGELTPPEFQAALGLIVSRWAHLEEMMIVFMSFLLSDDTFQSPARQIFRSVRSAEARIAILRSLLEESPRNQHRGAEFDEIIDEFASLTTERNNYVHGLWWTNEKTKAVRRADPNVTHEIGPTLTAKPVSLKQAIHVADRMGLLFGKIVTLYQAELTQRGVLPPPS
jgi:hypothetical protein